MMRVEERPVQDEVDQKIRELIEKGEATTREFDLVGRKLHEAETVQHSTQRTCRSIPQEGDPLPQRPVRSIT